MLRKLLSLCTLALAAVLFAPLAVAPFAYAQSAVPISQLPSPSTPLAGSELIPCVQGGVTKACTASNVANQSAGLTSNLVKGGPGGDGAPTGYIGEYQTITSGTPSMLSGTAVNCSSLILSAGDWDVQGTVEFMQSTGGILTTETVGISTTSAVQPSLGAVVQEQAVQGGGANVYIPSPVVRVDFASQTTVYLVGTANFASGSVNCMGFIRARRVR